MSAGFVQVDAAGNRFPVEIPFLKQRRIASGCILECEREDAAQRVWLSSRRVGYGFDPEVGNRDFHNLVKRCVYYQVVAKILP